MAFSGENKLFSEWQETTAPADDDYFLTGKSAIKKIKWSTIINLIKAKLGIADINKSISELNSSLKDNFGKTGGTMVNNSSYYPASYVYKSGQIVYLRCAGTLAKDVPASTELPMANAGVLPEEFLPNIDMIFYVIATATGKRVRVSFKTDGKITFTAAEDITINEGINIHVAFHTGKAAF